MSFKDLCKFNEAMLAKQVWRLIQDTSSLFYRVLKEKYFPNCSIFYHLDRLLGKVSSDPRIRLLEVLDGGLGMKRLFVFLRMLGC